MKIEIQIQKINKWRHTGMRLTLAETKEWTGPTAEPGFITDTTMNKIGKTADAFKMTMEQNQMKTEEAQRIVPPSISVMGPWEGALTGNTTIETVLESDVTIAGDLAGTVDAAAEGE
jgi:hypothetical protein